MSIQFDNATIDSLLNQCKGKEDVFGEGDKVAVRWHVTGTHTASLFGIPATGKSMDISGISILRLVDGKIAEDWVSEDTIGLMKQIGVIPA